MRIWVLFIVLALLLGLPFVFLGERFDQWFAGDGAVQWLRDYGSWAWAMGIGLLVADLILPIPATGIMAGLGILYGPVTGGLVGALGSMISGLFAYLICRNIGRPAARVLAGERDLVRAEAFFAGSGGWAVVCSRWMPLMPEVIACLAGLARMPFAVFCTALACGSAPMAFAYAYIGHVGADRPVLAIGVSVVLPLVLWMGFYRFAKRRI